MKNFVLILVAMILFTSCGKVPQDSYNTAQYCMDSLRSLGAENSLDFITLERKMKKTTEDLEIQKSLLFKKFEIIKVSLDEITFEARHFIMTNDRQFTNLNNINLNNVTHSSKLIILEVEVEFDSNQSRDEALKIAADVDDAVRRNLGTKAKLIRVKIIE